MFKKEYDYQNNAADYIDGLVHERRNSIANQLELLLSCTNPSIWNEQQNDKIHCVKQRCGRVGNKGCKPADIIHKSHYAAVPYPTILHLEQKCAHICGIWNSCIMGFMKLVYWSKRK